MSGLGVKIKVRKLWLNRCICMVHMRVLVCTATQTNPKVVGGGLDARSTVRGNPLSPGKRPSYPSEG